MSRKTISVQQVQDWANTGLACPDSTLRLEGLTPEQAFRLGLANLLEAVLHNTGNYHGFQFQASELVAEGTLRPDHDDTRRRYL